MDEERKLKIKGRPTKARALVRKVDAGGLTAERGLPIILFGLGGFTKKYKVEKLSRKVDDEKVFTSDTLDVLDAVNLKLSQWWRDKIKEGQIPEMDEIESVREFMGIVNYCDSIEYPKKDFFTAVISGGEIRSLIYRPHWSKSYIRKTIKNIGRWSLDGDVPVYSREDNWIYVPHTGGFAEVTVANEGKQYHTYRSGRKLRGKYGKGKEENVYIVRFIGRWGIAHALNVHNRKVIVMPERFYIKLSASQKILWRAISGKDINPVILNILQIARILGWQEEVVSPRDRVRKIEKILTGFKEEWFVDDFSRDVDDKEGVVFWYILKRKDWFQDPKLINM